MSRSRAAKEVCREFGEGSISCRVAKKREARRKEYGVEETAAPAPEAVEAGEAPPQSEEEKERGKKRREYLERKIKEAGG